MARKSKLRGVGGPGTGFFAFQDIITTVIAFVLLNILFQITLTRGLIDETAVPVNSSNTRKQIAELERELSTLQRTYDALSAQIDQTISNRGGASAQAIAATLESNRAALAEKVELLEKRLAELAKALGADASAMVAEAIRQEIARNQEALTTAKSQQQELERKRAELRKQILELQQQVAEALRQLRAIWVIAEPTSTSKAPLFGVVSAERVDWFRADDGRPRTSNRSDDWNAGRLSVAGHPATDYYTVLYFRPSAATHFRELVDALKKSRYEVGYDVLSEDQEITFVLR